MVVTGGWLFFPLLIRKGMIERLANEALFVNDLNGLIRSGFLIDLCKKKIRLCNEMCSVCFITKLFISR